jgi:hypothetical protein
MMGISLKLCSALLRKSDDVSQKVGSTSVEILPTGTGIGADRAVGVIAIF